MSKKVHKTNKFCRYVLVIGSGFHKQAYGEKTSNCLTSWDSLLKSIGCESTNPEKVNYILDFEMFLANKTGKQTDKAANKIEQEILNNIAQNIEKEQKTAVSKLKNKYPLEIFNPEKVSDVISLNFDLVPEILLSNGNITRAKYCHQQTENKRGDDVKRKIKNTRHRIIGNKQNSKITFWHPHGDIGTPSSLQLGIRKYGTSIDHVETLRKRFKQNEPQSKHKTKNYVESWYDKIMNQPVIIIGASMSDNEWDLWYALVNKVRNFARKSNKQYESKIFKMNCDCNCNSIHNDIFTDIIPNSTDCKEQWQAVIEMLE